MKKYIKEIIAAALILFCFIFKTIAYISLPSKFGYKVWFAWPIFEFLPLVIALITVTVFKIYQSSKGKSSFGSGFDFEWTIED